MIKKSVLLIGLISLGLSSCIEHEVIPAPIPHVDLTCHFEGMVGGQFVEYTENVDGYYGLPTIARQNSGGITDAQYFFQMLSDQQPSASIRIGLGSITWNDASGTQIPSLSLFNGFFTANDEPDYSDDALAGFEVAYFAQNGEEWASKETSTFINADAQFFNIVQDQDDDGDYSMFTCHFDCYLYHTFTDPNPPFDTWEDSILVEDAVLTGWFKR